MTDAQHISGIPIFSLEPRIRPCFCNRCFWGRHIIPRAVCHHAPTSHGKEGRRGGRRLGPGCHLFSHHQHPDLEGGCPVATSSSTTPTWAWPWQRSLKLWGGLSAPQVCPSTLRHPGQPHTPVVVGPNPAPRHGLVVVLGGAARVREAVLPCPSSHGHQPHHKVW